MKNFKYSLETGSKKYHCPACNKKTFVRYIDIETGNYLHENIGRCDREEKCKYHRKPETEFIETFNYIAPVEKPQSYHNYNLVSKSNSHFNENNFVQYLYNTFPNEKVKNVIDKYKLGTSKHWTGSTIFWQIDNQNKVHHGKVMLYDKSNGKRLKNNVGKGYISSVRSVLKLDHFNLKQCLFGLHLVDEKAKSIAVVEAEKTAIVMSIIMPEYIWLSTGSLTGFKYENLQPIRKYNIIAFPDKDCFNTWQTKADELKKYGFKINVNDILENSNLPKGSDIADIVLQPVKKVKIPKRIYYDPTFTSYDYEVCKELILKRKTDEPKDCFDMDGIPVTQSQSDTLIQLLV